MDITIETVAKHCGQIAVLEKRTESMKTDISKLNRFCEESSKIMENYMISQKELSEEFIRIIEELESKNIILEEKIKRLEEME